MDLFRRVPQELVRIWEANSLKGLKQQSMEEVYAEWRRLNITVQLVKLSVWLVIICTGAVVVTALLTISGMVLQDRQDTWLQLGACASLLVFIFLLYFVMSSEKFRSINTSLERYENAIRDFNLRIENLRVLGEKSFKPASVREYLYVLAHDVVVAERRVDAANDSDAKPEDIRLAQRQLEHARQEFEPYFTTVHFFAGYFNPPRRTRVFQTVGEQIDRQQ